MKMELHLVADTNLFFEFKALEQLPWNELGADPIVIMLTKPVLDEIDKHKKGTGRTRDRAIDIFGRFRAMLESGASEAMIQASSPRVVLRRATSVLPDPSLKEHLDYDKPDERLIGIVAALNARASGCDVKLFTDDGGPAGMALDLAVPFMMIDQTWRRPAAETTEAKRLKEVEKDLALYRSQEPRIAIRCDQAGQDKTVCVIRKVAAALNKGEIDEVLAALVRKHPEAKDFTPPADLVVTQPSGDVTTTAYAAPLKEDIVAYRDVQRPAWIESCRGVLQSLHVGRDEAEPSLELRWAMANEGTRPAVQVRVEFEAKGPLRIFRVRDEAEDDEDAAERKSAASPAQSPRFPPPPKPPAFGETITVSPAPTKRKLPGGVDLVSLRGAGPSAAQLKMAANAMAGLDLSRIGRVPNHLDATRIAGASRLLQDGMFNRSYVDRLLAPSSLSIATPNFPSLPNLQRYLPEERKPEEFYYSSWPANVPVVKGALICESWRHQTNEEVFEFEVVLEQEGEVRGVVECAVHAHNLTKPTHAKVFVERKLEAISMLALAKSLIDACT